MARPETIGSSDEELIALRNGQLDNMRNRAIVDALSYAADYLNVVLPMGTC